MKIVKLGIMIGMALNYWLALVLEMKNFMPLLLIKEGKFGLDQK